MSKPTGYTRRQVRLHWIVFILVALQFIFHDGISDAWEKIEKGGAMEFSLLVGGHVVGGVLILLLALWRMKIKAKRGAPALPDNESRLQQIAAHATHGLLYLLTILIPVSGLVAWFGGVKPAAEGHEVMTTILLILVGLHVLAALYHHFVLKSDVLRRMLKGEN